MHEVLKSLSPGLEDCAIIAAPGTVTFVSGEVGRVDQLEIQLDDGPPILVFGHQILCASGYRQPVVRDGYRAVVIGAAGTDDVVAVVGGGAQPAYVAILSDEAHAKALRRHPAKTKRRRKAKN